MEQYGSQLEKGDHLLREFSELFSENVIFFSKFDETVFQQILELDR